MLSPEQRFWPKVCVRSDTECWEWTAALRDGYGAFAVKSTRPYVVVGAHRYAYEQLVGPVPEGLEIDHLCRNRKCVNPAHLQAVTRRENVLRGVSPPARQARQTHCKRGHSLADAYVWNRMRICRICHADHERARRARAREVAA